MFVVKHREQEQNMNAIIYSRVSTEEQAESGHGLNAQLDACLAFASQQGLTVVGQFSDEGISGTADIEKREGLMMAIEHLSAGDVLIVAKRDRLGRDVVLVKMIERLVSKRKAVIHALNGATGDSPEAQLSNGIMDLFSAYEVAIIRARTKAALGAKKARGERMGKLPYGFTVADDGVHLIPCPGEQLILRRIADLRDSGFSLRAIAKALNEDGLFNRQGNPWNNVSILTLTKDLNERLAA
jgi:DNA invertase Pin-like site-specific DNA recombinase